MVKKPSNVVKANTTTQQHPVKNSVQNGTELESKAMSLESQYIEKKSLRLARGRNATQTQTRAKVSHGEGRADEDEPDSHAHGDGAHAEDDNDMHHVNHDTALNGPGLVSGNGDVYAGDADHGENEGGGHQSDSNLGDQNNRFWLPS